MAQLWSFNFLSKLMRAANCVRLCLNPFCYAVHEGCLPHTKKKKDSDKTVHNLQFTPLEVERPELSTTFSFFRYFTRLKK